MVTRRAAHGDAWHRAAHGDTPRRAGRACARARGGAVVGAVAFVPPARVARLAGDRAAGAARVVPGVDVLGSAYAAGAGAVPAEKVPGPAHGRSRIQLPRLRPGLCADRGARAASRVGLVLRGRRSVLRVPWEVHHRVAAAAAGCAVAGRRTATVHAGAAQGAGSVGGCGVYGGASCGHCPRRGQWGCLWIYVQRGECVAHTCSRGKCAPADEEFRGRLHNLTLRADLDVIVVAAAVVSGGEGEQLEAQYAMQSNAAQGAGRQLDHTP
eukprot:199653-Chlamydomonas_euryale.AAC.1